MHGLDLLFDEKPSTMEVQRFITKEVLSETYRVDVWARSPDPSIDLERLVGKKATFIAVTGGKNDVPDRRSVFDGVCERAEQVRAEPTGLSTYHVRIVPRLWLLTQRRNYRIYQHVTAKDIVSKLFGEWQVDATWKLTEVHEKHLYKVQYGETDFAFVCRILEEAGIAFAFVQQPNSRELVLSDSFHGQDPRPGDPIKFVDHPNESSGDWFREFVSQVRLSHSVRPGKNTVRDYDFRRPDYPLFSKAKAEAAPEDKYERYRYIPGGALAEISGPGGSPQDDLATARHDDGVVTARATRALEAVRGGKRAVELNTNVLDLWPGIVFLIGQHTHSELPATRRLLLLSFTTEGTPVEEWSMGGEATFADVPFRPPLRTVRPTARLQTAVVVGPKGQEIHTDEYGRIRVQFPWDREGKDNENSTPWIRTSQGWAGKGFGMIQLPRIGQEVLVDFLDGDPEQPVIVGRVHNQKDPVPYRLPEFKTRGGIHSDSSIGSHGYNEVYFEDIKGAELLNVQAEKNLRHLVKNNETITVGKDREKKVAVNEWEYTGTDRVEFTGVDRSETTGINRTTVIGGNREMIVGGDETERDFVAHESCVVGDQDIKVGGMRREAVREDDHLVIDGEHREKVGGHRSLQIEDDQLEKTGKRYAKFARKEMHLKAVDKLVMEAGVSFTFRGPGGYVRIGPAGVSIQGKVVKINSGGSPESGLGTHPTEPELAAGEHDEESGHEGEADPSKRK